MGQLQHPPSQGLSLRREQKGQSKPEVREYRNKAVSFGHDSVTGTLVAPTSSLTAAAGDQIRQHSSMQSEEVPLRRCRRLMTSGEGESALFKGDVPSKVSHTPEDGHTLRSNWEVQIGLNGWLN